MKKYLLILFVFFFVLKVNGQEAQNIADLDFLYQEIKKLPSYKDQLKGDEKYEQLYQNLRANIKSSNDFEVFQQLSQLLIPIRDNHLGLWRKPDSSYTFTPEKYTIDSLTLINKYLNYAKDSIEGIYNGGRQKYVIERVKPNEYRLIQLSNGNLTAILYKNAGSGFDILQFLKYPSSFTLLRNIKLTNQILNGTNYYKGEVKAFYNILSRKEKYEYKVIEDQIGYLSLGTFNSSDEEIKAATDFFTNIKSTINVKHLIVDVRNNFGGGYKNSGQFISFLKNYQGKIYILQNGYTVSNAEQFIIALKGRANIKTLGELTKGTISYGSNYGKTLTLPSNRFMFYPTDMGANKKELAFESVGIKPDVELDPFTEDWIVQTINYIKTNDKKNTNH